MISELSSGNNFLPHIGSVLLQKPSDMSSEASFRQKTNKLLRQNSGSDGNKGKKNSIEITFINTSPNV